MFASRVGALRSIAAVLFVLASCSSGEDPQPTPPAAPDGLTATPLSATRIDLAWADRSSDETGFRIERSAAATGPWAVVQTVAPDVSSWSDDTVVPLSPLWYRVCATNAAGDSAFAGPATATTQPPPAAPSGLAAATGGPHAIGLSWDAAAGVTGFVVERASLEAGPYAVVADLPASATSWSDTGLGANTTRWYRLRARSAWGESEPTAPVSASTAPAYTISGRVAGATVGTFLAGVTVTLSGAADAVTATDGDGRYAFTNLANGRYTLTPAATGVTFRPASLTVTIAGADLPDQGFTANPPSITEFAVGAGPQRIVAAPDGALWFTECTANKIGRLTTLGELTEYPLPNPGSCPYGIAVYTTPAVAPPLGSHPFGIVFTERTGNRVGVLHPGDGSIHEIAVPTAASCPAEIAGNTSGQTLAWFTEACDPDANYLTNSFGSFDPWGLVVTEHATGARGSRFAGIAETLDGTVWFAQANPTQGAILKYASGRLTTCYTPSWQAQPFSLVPTPDGKVWFTELGDSSGGGQLAVLDPAANCLVPASAITEQPVPWRSNPMVLVRGPSCVSGGAGGFPALWFSDGQGGFGCYEGGTFTRFAPSLVPGGLAVGPDGNLWFTEPGAGKVGRLLAP